MKICPKCRTEFDKRVNFCSECGTKLILLTKEYFDDIIQKANTGDPQAQLLAGDAYLSGRIVPQDLSKAFMYYTFSANQNNPQASFCLGKCFYNGVGCIKNHQESLKWFLKAIEGGVKVAYGFVGFLYYAGEGIEHDPVKGFQFTFEAAKTGDANAMSNLSKAYYSGNGTQQNDQEGFKWLEKAADMGFEESIITIADTYYNGDGVQVDYSKSFHYFLMGAKKGNPYAMYSLGWQLINGEGCDVNESDGMKWIQQAASQGDENAIAYLTPIEEPNQQINEFPPINDPLGAPVVDDEENEILERINDLRLQGVEITADDHKIAQGIMNLRADGITADVLYSYARESVEEGNYEEAERIFLLALIEGHPDALSSYKEIRSKVVRGLLTGVKILEKIIRPRW